MELVIAKVISVACILVLSLFFGTLPCCLILANRGNPVALRRGRVVRYLNCLSGGVFLGALFLDLIPEGSEEFEKYLEIVQYDSGYPFFNAMIIMGFFLTSSIEHFAHSVLTPKERPSPRSVVSTPIPNADKEESERLQDGRTKGYGSLASGSNTIIRSDPVDAMSDTDNSVVHAGNGYNVSHNDGGRDSVTDHVSVASSPHHQLGTNNIRSILLLLALSFHSVFDGLALGLQQSVSKVWQIFVAVALHKCIVASCLGLDVFMNFSDTKVATLMMVMFSLVSPIGASVGISLTSSGINETAQLLASGILQALSCGAFLYVTFLEILNTYWRDGNCRRSFLDIICSFIGFTIMALLKILDS